MISDSQDRKTKVLVIDDDQKLCRLIKEYLEPLGYNVQMVHTGTEGLAMALEGKFDVAILDVMLPGLNGWEVLKELRKKSNLPVLMLTGLGEETDRIVGLEMGADDYLPKTFSTRELLARLRAVTRRTVNSSKNTSADLKGVIQIRNLSINPNNRIVNLDNAPVELTPIEFDILHTLAANAGIILNRDQLLDRISGRSYDVFDRSIDVHISALRRKLKEAPHKPKFIKTVRSVGYMFVKND